MPKDILFVFTPLRWYMEHVNDDEYWIVRFGPFHFVIQHKIPHVRETE